MFLGILGAWNSGLLRYVKVYAFKKTVSGGDYSAILEITLEVCTLNTVASGDGRDVWLLEWNAM
jgi:hypothetical protein